MHVLFTQTCLHENRTVITIFGCIPFFSFSLRNSVEKKEFETKKNTQTMHEIIASTWLIWLIATLWEWIFFVKRIIEWWKKIVFPLFRDLDKYPFGFTLVIIMQVGLSVILNKQWNDFKWTNGLHRKYILIHQFNIFFHLHRSFTSPPQKNMNECFNLIVNRELFA